MSADPPLNSTSSKVYKKERATVMFLEMMAHTDFRTCTGTCQLRRRRERAVVTNVINSAMSGLQKADVTYRNNNLQIVGGQFFKLRPW